MFKTFSLRTCKNILTKNLISANSTLPATCAITDWITNNKKLTIEENKYKTQIPTSYFGDLLSVSNIGDPIKWPQVTDNIDTHRFPITNNHHLKKLSYGRRNSSTNINKHCHEIRIEMKNFSPGEIRVQIKADHKIQVLGRHDNDRLKAVYMIPYDCNIEKLQAYYNRGQVVIQVPRFDDFTLNVCSPPMPKSVHIPDELHVKDINTNEHYVKRRNK